MQYHLKKNEYALTLLEVLLLPDSAKSDGGINHKGGGGSKVMGSSAPLFNDTKWDVG